MPSLGSFAAGPYTCTYNGQNVGLLDPQGTGRAITLQIQELNHIIQGHLYGRTPIDGVQQGGDHIISMIAEEQLAGALKALWPHSTTAVASYTVADLSMFPVVGKLHTNIAQNLILTAVAGTTAATLGPASLTALAYPTEDTKQIVMDTELRKFPIILRCLLQEYSSVKRFWSST